MRARNLYPKILTDHCSDDQGGSADEADPSLQTDDGNVSLRKVSIVLFELIETTEKRVIFSIFRQKHFWIVFIFCRIFVRSICAIFAIFHSAILQMGRTVAIQIHFLKNKMRKKEV